MLDKERFMEMFAKAGIAISDEQFCSFDRYGELLVQWNEKINLTAITDPEGIAVKHFFDSIYPFFLVGIPRDSTLIDIGAGAGFPSCPVKIWRDDIQITLLDSLQKRITFLAQLSDQLSLGATCLHARAEELGRNGKFREQFDFATARAVANLTDLCEYCLPFVKVGGSFIALKGPDAGGELEDARGAIKLLGGEVSSLQEYTLPSGDGRTVIVIEKAAQTPERFPRSSAQIKKKRL